jgi:hypothetical protein
VQINGEFIAWVKHGNYGTGIKWAAAGAAGQKQGHAKIPPLVENAAKSLRRGGFIVTQSDGRWQRATRTKNKRRILCFAQKRALDACSHAEVCYTERNDVRFACAVCDCAGHFAARNTAIQKVRKTT